MRIPALVVPVLAAVSLGGCNDLQLIPITPEITTSALEDGTVGTPYSAQLKAVGGTGPYTWSLESLPAELGWLKVETVDSTIGQLGGNPDKHGSFSFRAQVTDSKGRVSSPRSFALIVNACKENDPVPCYYVANEQCYTNSLICTNGDISGTCGNGTLSDDVNHCGAGANGTCGVCSSTTADNCNGTCMCGTNAACSGSLSCCNQNCVDTQTDANNCGSCGHICSSPEIDHAHATCNSGQCSSVCDTDYMPCSGGCCSKASALSAGGGSGHSCALLKNGTIECWGYNEYGSLGDDSYVDKHSPVQVHELRGDATAITAGFCYTCAIVNGSVLCWGDILEGIGYPQHKVPAPISGLSSGAQATALGDAFACALVNSGVQCWGNDVHGVLGSTTHPPDCYTPVQVSGLTSNVQAIAAGKSHACALMNTGNVQCWGDNTSGQLGNSSCTTNCTPSSVVDSSSVPITGVAAITAGGQYTCALMENGGVKCWGRNSNGQLGNNSIADSHVPVAVVDFSGTPISGVTAVDAGYSHTCVVVNGGVQCWGSNTNGQLGNKSTSESHIPVTVLDSSGNAALSGIAAITAGDSHTCALMSGGGGQCWGLNFYGQLGNSSTNESHLPVSVQF